MQINHALGDHFGSRPPPAPQEVQTQSPPTRTLRAADREALSAIISEYTDLRYAAVYPIGRNLIAINDGARISVHPSESLSDALRATLEVDGMIYWLVIDAQQPADRWQSLDVASANEFLDAFNRRRAEEADRSGTSRRDQSQA